MSKSDFYRPRLTIEISQDQYDKLRELLRRGNMRPVFLAIIDSLIELLEQHGEIAVAAIISRDYNILDRLRKGNL